MDNNLLDGIYGFNSLARAIIVLISENKTETIETIVNKADKKELMNYLTKYNDYMNIPINDNYIYNIEEMNSYLSEAVNDLTGNISHNVRRKHSITSPDAGLPLLLSIILSIFEMHPKGN